MGKKDGKKLKIGIYGGEFFPQHLGHVNAMVMASTIVDELHVVVSHDEEYEKQVFCGTYLLISALGFIGMIFFFLMRIGQ